MAYFPSEEEQEVWKKKFDEADINKNGTISFDELEPLLKSIGMEKPTPLQLKFLFKTMDTDEETDEQGQKSISFEEFLGLTGPFVRMKMIRMFKEADTNGDRKLDEQEFGKVLRSLAESNGAMPSDTDIKEIMKQADADDNKKINYEEFVDFFTGGLIKKKK